MTTHDVSSTTYSSFGDVDIGYSLFWGQRYSEDSSCGDR
jgi:hypothetical protein